MWVNLKIADKMVEPSYQELLDKDIPKKAKDGVYVKVIAGESLGIKVDIKESLLYITVACKTN